MMYRFFIRLEIVLSVMCVVVESGCIFQGSVHKVGETWNPPTFGTCVNCTCQISKTGEPEVRCVNKADVCPKVTCAIPKRDPHSCCPYCEVRADDDKSSSSNRAPCTTPGGRVYNDGEVYSSNDTGLVPTLNNQCVLCVCQNGKSLCHLKTCHAPKTCSSFFQTQDDCCPVCADCQHVDVGGIKANGTTWHPSIASIGQIDCITCTCINGNIKCKKDCIPDHKLPCQYRKPNGECCKACPAGARIQPEKPPRRKHNKKDRKERKKKRKGKNKRRRRKCRGKNKDKKRCKRRKRQRGKKKAAKASGMRATSAPGIDLDNLCIRRKSTYLVYKAISESEMFIAFDDIKGNTVDVYKWTIDKGNKPSVVSYKGPEVVDAQQFRRQINNTNVVGTTGKKQYRKFKRRLKDKLDKCNSECQPELFIKILQRVKVHLLKFGEQCKT